MNPPLRLLVAFESLIGEPPDQIAGVPERDMWAACRWGQPDRWQVYVPDLEAQVLFTPRSIRNARNAVGRPIPPWARYLRGICHTLEADNLLPVDGGRLVVVGDEPHGPRYEFSLAMTLAAVCAACYEQQPTHAELVEWVERGMRALG